MTPEIPPPLPAVTGDYAAACLLPLVSDVQIHCVLHFPQPLDAARLASAVRLSFDAEPVLGCNPLFDKDKLIWRRREDFTDAEYFQQERSEDTEAALKAFLCAPLDALRDPVAQARVIGDTVLCLKVSHIVGYAAAVKNYAYRLAEIYRRLAQDPAYIPPVNHGSRSLRQLARVFSVTDKLKIVRRGIRNNLDLWWPKNKLRRCAICPVSSISIWARNRVRTSRLRCD